MIPMEERLRIVVVSEDWFARSLLESTANETGLFSRVVAAEDGYTAIAETWQCIEDGGPPDIIIADSALSIMTAPLLCQSLRSNAETEGIFFAVMTEFTTTPEEDAPLVEGADFATACSAGSSDLLGILEEVASRAANLIRGASGQPSRDFGHRE